MSRDTYATHFETRAWLFILASSREGGYLRYSMTLFSRTTLVRVATRSQTMNSEPGRNEIETPMAASQMWAWICVTHTHMCVATRVLGGGRIDDLLCFTFSLQSLILGFFIFKATYCFTESPNLNGFEQAPSTRVRIWKEPILACINGSASKRHFPLTNFAAQYTRNGEKRTAPSSVALPATILEFKERENKMRACAAAYWTHDIRRWEKEKDPF